MKKLTCDGMGKHLRSWGIMCVKILFGAAIDAIGVSFLMYRCNIITGGIMGISMILNQIIASPVGIVTIAINIPLFIAAWRAVGLKFFIGSALGMGAASLFLDLFNTIPVMLTANPLLAAIFGGVLSGLGQGIIYSVGGSTGGLDIVTKILRRRYQFLNIGVISMGLNAVIFVGYAVVLGAYEPAMYSVVALFISSRLIDTVLYGINFAKICYVITEKGTEISDMITKKLDRGVTQLQGRGAYSGRDKTVLLCAIRRQQVTELRRIVRETDPSAFVIISETREVMGNGFEYLEEAD